MKKFISSIAIFLLVLTGCTQSGTEDTEQNMMSYETVKGTIEYPENPTIYADYNVGEWLYLDADIIGADMTYPVKSWSDIADEQGVANISEDMEQIAALKPDLIYTIHEDFYDQYSTIAPTIYIPYGTYSPEELLVEFGKIIGKEDVANEWVNNFETSLDELATEIDNPELTVSIVDAWSGTPTMYGANFGRGGYILYDKLGLKGTEKAEEDYIRNENSYMEVDAESMLQYVGDVLFIVDNGQGSLEAVQSLATYQDLEAVKEGHVYVINNDIFGYSDPYSLDNQVEALKEIYETEEI